MRSSFYRQLQSPNGNRVLAQRGQRNRRARFKDFHNKLPQRLLDCQTQRLANPRQAAAKHYDLRVKQMHYMRKAKREVLGHCLQDRFGGRISFCEPRRQMLCFRAGLRPCHAGQQSPRLLPVEPLNPCIKRPPRAARFEGCPAPIQAHMADLCLPGGGAVIDVAVQNQPAADTAAKRNIKHRVRTHPGSMPSLRQRRDVGIIIYCYRDADQIAQPFTKIEFRPTCDLMGTADVAGPPIDRPAKTDARRKDTPLTDHLRHCFLELRAYPGGAGKSIDAYFAAFSYLPVFVSQCCKQLCPSDFNSQEPFHLVLAFGMRRPI